MKRIEIEVLKPSEALNAFKNTWNAAKGNKKVTPRIVFGSLRELFSSITEKRMEVIRFIAAHEGLNTRQVSHELARDYKNIHTDVSHLIEIGLLEKDEDGLLYSPYDEIVIHTNIRDVA